MYCDSDIVEDEEILDLFLRDDKREIVPEMVELVPQLFWGNLKDPQLVILGKNPSYTVEDELDCKYYSKELKENLKVENHCDAKKEDVVNLLSNLSNRFYTSNASRWWRRYLSGLSKNNDNKQVSMSEIGIFNIYGYYAKDGSPDEAYHNAKMLEKAHIIKYIDTVYNVLQTAKTIVIMWKGSIPAWEYLLRGKCKDFFRNGEKDIYVANIKCNNICVLQLKDELKIKNIKWDSIKEDNSCT